jgi:histidine-containing phosphotransfer protein
VRSSRNAGENPAYLPVLYLRQRARTLLLWLQDSTGKIDRIGQMLASASPDFNELDQLVHQFKGSSASLGAQAIAQLCIRLREQCQVRNGQGCSALLEQVRQAYDVLRTQLSLFMQLEAQRKQLLASGQ